MKYILGTLISLLMICSSEVEAACKECKWGSCIVVENGFTACTSEGCKMDGETEVCKCSQSGSSCQTASPIPIWWPTTPPNPDTDDRDWMDPIVFGDARKKVATRLIGASQGAVQFPNDFAHALLFEKLSTTHSKEVIHALSSVMNSLHESGELPQVVEIVVKKRSTETVDVWDLVSAHKFAVNASDRKLRTSSVFELQLIKVDEKDVAKNFGGNIHRFSYSSGKLQALPHVSQEN